MDRMIIVPGPQALATDQTNAARFVMIQAGMTLSSILGLQTWISGLACAPTSPASLTVNVGQGMISTASVVDTTAFGTLPSASEPLVKMGINIDPTPFTFVAPASSGQSQVFLIEAQFLEADAVPVVLPYFNSNNPSLPFSGPSNSGVPQNTQRTQRVSLQVKAGTAASTGSQVAPAVDAGWTPVWLVTLANGTTAITSGNIAQHPAAPFIQFDLPSAGGELATFIGASGQTLNIADWTQLGRAIALTHGRQFVATTSTTFTVPAGVYLAKFRVWGAGGGGGGASGTGSIGSGGGGGENAEGFASVTPGQVLTLTVGTAGAGGAPGANGTAGGTTTIPTIISAVGGGPGAGATSAIAGTAGVGGTGGVGGTDRTPGNPGGTGVAAGSAYFSGQGGGSTYPAPPLATSNSTTPQNGGTGVGAGVGGGGGIAGGNGGNGASGKIVIEY